MRRSFDQQSTDWNQLVQQKTTLAKLETAQDFNKVRIADLEVEAQEATTALKRKEAELKEANQRLEQLEHK